MAIDPSIPQLLTTGRIARLLDVPQHRVCWLIRTRGIAPAAYAAQDRLFDPDVLDFIKSELEKIDAKHTAAGAIAI